jgi:hypothetical protein
MDQVIAAVGAVLVLLAFWLVSTDRVHADDTSYQLLNLLGAGLLATGAVMTESWAFVALNTIWAAVALSALVRRTPS